jgi:hypothetical protein
MIQGKRLLVGNKLQLELKKIQVRLYCSYKVRWWEIQYRIGFLVENTK